MRRVAPGDGFVVRGNGQPVARWSRCVDDVSSRAPRWDLVGLDAVVDVAAP